MQAKGIDPIRLAQEEAARENDDLVAAVGGEATEASD
jgi:hypothetical protein